MALTARNVTVYGRLSYAHLFQPHAQNENADPKYSAVILIPKDDTATVQRIQAAIQAAVNDAVEKRTFKQAIDPMATKYPPLRDGDTPTDNGDARGAEFAGHWFISAKAPTKMKPHVVDQQVQPIIDEAEIYSGCYCNFAVEFFGYENSGNRGISASLRGVQKVKDGERLGGPALEADDVFSAIGTPPQPQSNPSLGF